MNKNDILILAKAGFNAAQIGAILGVAKPEEKPAEKPAEPKPEEKPVEKPAEPKPEEPSQMDFVVRALNKLTQTIQASNIAGTRQPEDTTESAEDALFGLIH